MPESSRFPLVVPGQRRTCASTCARGGALSIVTFPAPRATQEVLRQPSFGLLLWTCGTAVPESVNEIRLPRAANVVNLSAPKMVRHMYLRIPLPINPEYN